MSEESVRLENCDHLSPTQKSEMEQGREQLSRMHEAIRAESPIGFMPPVAVYPEIWMEGKLHIPAFTRFANFGNRLVFAAHVSAPVALSGKQDRMREILVHEFSHCFYWIGEAVVAMKAGTKLDLRGIDSADPEVEARSHVQSPEKWFSRRDLPIVQWNDAQLQEFDAVRRRIRGGPFRTWLPTYSPISGQYDPPPEVLDYLDRIE